MSRTSLIEHLQRLPEVFDLQLFCLTTGIDRGSAKVMMSRWAQRGHIELAGPKAGIYFKRLGSNMEPGQQIAAAVCHLYPGAALCGASVLHRNGWTTQIPHTLHIAVPTRPSLTQLHGVILFERPHQWFTDIYKNKGFEPALTNESLRDPFSRLRILKPAWALEDLRHAQDGWIPDEDDLDLPESEKALAELDRAKAFLDQIYGTQASPQTPTESGAILEEADEGNAAEAPTG